jgi:hypothetical protein
LAALVAPAPSRAVTGPRVEVWKDAACGCCEGWIRHLRDAGFEVQARNVADMAAVKRASGVPEPLWSCHTALVEGYVVEGHVPAGDLRRLLAERPRARGLSAPGMPASAPGMDIPGEPYQVVIFGLDGGGEAVFARH